MFLLLCLISSAAAQTASSITCGSPAVQPITTKIVGGKEAIAGSWPWMTLLVDDLDFISGSGAIIHPHVIMTSAQHFEGPGYSVFDLDLRHWKVYVGEHNINRDDPHEKFVHVRRVVLHPGFNQTSLENDIALVFTVEPMTFNNNVRPGCLPDATHTYQTGSTCFLPGWGSTESSGNEEVLNQVALPILADSVCQQHWPDFLPNTEICAGYEDAHKDFCSDDIGSPLMCKSQNGKWYIEGIASSGGDCHKANEPGVFEDVTQYVDWVKRTMETGGYPYQY